MDSSAWGRAFLIRRAERRLLELFGEGKLSGTVHTCIGQELSALAVIAALEPTDAVFTNHRGHGHFLARTGDLRGLFAEVLGREGGVCGGRGGSQHLHAANYYSNGILGGMAASAAGCALARARKADGSLAVLFVGDGALGEGIVYEALNVAGLWKLPLLVVVEDNGIAQSTRRALAMAGTIEARARAFGLEAFSAATAEPDSLFERARVAAAHARYRGPALLHIETARLAPHSKGDDDRPGEEVALLEAADPLARLERERPEDARTHQEAAARAVDEALAAAEASPLAKPAAPQRPASPPPSWVDLEPAPAERGAARVHAALERALAEDPRVLVLGCDIEGPYGGAFKATRDLSRRFPGRVRNTPVSEPALAGLGAGLALEGQRPVIEIMFGDFLGLTFDQWLNHAAKFGEMFGAPVPLVLRTPMGGGRGYGPTHSQSLEKHWLGIPGTRVVAVNGRWDPAALYAAVFATLDRPTLVIEHKRLYAEKVTSAAPPGFRWRRTSAALPTLRLSPEAEARVSIVAAGGALALAERAAETLFDEDELAAEVLVPTSLYPLDLAPILESVGRTGRLVCVEEGQGFAGLGAEVAAACAQALGPRLLAVRRVAAAETILPAAPALERAALPDAAAVVAAAREAAGA